MRRAWLAVLAALLPLAAATPAAAQRGVAGPIYERNIDALIEGAEPGALRMLIGASRSRSARTAG
ncbi:hypothetical protein [Belnapia sp. F-4-1]|uniref:hypothetical protein n=1 Tax=Belnapia sp. F-4-1 TaxID=1545443 RepID=UPI0005B7C561|nr:hypothetical protein [Belnapia sp. F-4-1]